MQILPLGATAKKIRSFSVASAKPPRWKFQQKINRFRYTQRALAVSIAWRWAYLLPLISNAKLNRDGLGCFVVADRYLFSYVLNFPIFSFFNGVVCVAWVAAFSYSIFSKIGQISNNAERIVRPHFQCKVYVKRVLRLCSYISF